MNTSTKRMIGRLLTLAGSVLLGIGVVASCLTLLALAIVAIVDRDHVGTAFRAVLWAGQTVCVGVVLRFAGTTLVKRIKTRPASNGEEQP